MYRILYYFPLPPLWCDVTGVKEPCCDTVGYGSLRQSRHQDGYHYLGFVGYAAKFLLNGTSYNGVILHMSYFFGSIYHFKATSFFDAVSL